MTKNEYLQGLKQALKSVSKDERERSLAYFAEVIDDRMEDGISEEAAVAELEPIGDAAQRIISDAEARGAIKPKHSVMMIVLLVLGFPLWFPLLLSVAVVVLSVYLVFWIALIVLYILILVLGLCGVVGIFGLIPLLPLNIYSALAVLGVGLGCAGVGVALFLPITFLTRAYIKGSSKLFMNFINSIRKRRGVRA